MDKVDIKVPQEFSFKENLSYLLRSTNECMFEIQDGKSERRFALWMKCYCLRLVKGRMEILYLNL